MGDRTFPPPQEAGDYDGFLNEPIWEGPASIAIRTGETCWLKDITDTPSIDAIRSAALKRYTSVLSLPLKRDGKILGALTIYADDLGKFNERIIELLQEWSISLHLK